MNRNVPRSAIILAALCAAACSVSAANFTWNGSGNGANANLWSAQQNWVNNAVPTASDIAVFTNIVSGNSKTPLVNVPASINTITFTPNATNFTIGGTSTLTIGSGGVVNNSTHQQAINTTTVALSASQTWNANNEALSFGGTTLNLGANTLTVTGNFDTTINNAITGTGGIIKNGDPFAALNLGGANTYSGSTVVNSGIVNLFGVQHIGAISLASGTILNQQNSLANTFGALSGSGTATLNLATAGSLTFSSADWVSGGTLDIVGWQGAAGSSGTGSQIFVTGTATSDFLNAVHFAGFQQGGLIIANNELAPVPEPSTYAAIFGLGLVAFAIVRRRMVAMA